MFDLFPWLEEIFDYCFMCIQAFLAFLTSDYAVFALPIVIGVASGVVYAIVYFIVRIIRHVLS